MRPVLVFDSGSGGLSVWQEIHARLPDLDTAYCADFAAAPYGMLTDSAIEARVIAVMDQARATLDPGLIVIACNTASTLLLDTLRARYPVPFVGVVPAIKTAAALTRNKRICLLATPATVKRAYTEELIRQFAGDCEVSRLPRGELVHAAEAFVRGKPVDTELSAVLAQIDRLAVDTVVLGCTHFPLLKTLFQQERPDIHWIDSGAAIARRVESLCEQQDLRLSVGGTRLACYTGPEDEPWEACVAGLGFAQRLRWDISAGLP